MRAAAWIDDSGVLHSDGVADAVPWWSFGKTVLAIAALRLVGAGRLSLSAPVDGARYNLAQLLRHEAGLPDYGGVAAYHEAVDAGRPPWPVKRLLTVLDVDRLRDAPGEGWAYSNVGYLIVAQLIERACGRPLHDALHEWAFDPAGLTTARLATQPGDLDAVQMGDAQGYHPGWVYHGLVVGTVADAARLLHALLAGRLLPPDRLAQMFDVRALPQFRSAAHPDPGYGLGLMAYADDPRRHPAGHGGSGPGSTIEVYGCNGRAAAVWAATSSGANPFAEVIAHLQTQ
ncbi:serine hydrolase domain-containing protein [Solimonas marina]|uniref:Beta-lactamase family protein n=1 Tax=Solimonas marina TaxID=2714601 RepID=A0A969WEI2_9GAMM|nr:serine hydrolase domain-containing protein [Solimonas marina]NKF24655.1 beta-lactamase family protein [Solimonas marina]